MSQTVLAFLGVGSGVLNIIGVVPYIRGILKGKTKPERSAWWIWTWLMVVAFWAQASAGATWSLFLTGSFLVCNLAIAFLSLRHGYGRFRQTDLLAICVAVLGIIAWKATDKPLLALIVVVVVDFSGVLLVAEKSWRAPYTENLLAWALVSLAALVGLLSVGSWNAAKVIFPVYVLVSNLLLTSLIDYRRHWRSSRVKNGLRANT